MVILNKDDYCKCCGAYLPDKDDFVEFRSHRYCDIDCWEKYLVKNSIRYPYGVLFDEEMYNSFDHLYVECFDETIQR